MAIGFAFPFSASSGSIGYFDTTNDEMSAATADLKSLVLTSWGERVGHYYMGCNLREFLFENMRIDELRERISNRIFDQVNTWLPFIRIRNVQLSEVSVNDVVVENSLAVKIEFGMVNQPDTFRSVSVIVS